MEVKAVYKRTEIGILPADWEIDKIKNIALIGTGSKNTEDKIDFGKYPFFVRSQIVEKIDSYAFDGEAVLTAGDGVGTGKIYHYINGKFNFHQRVYKISNFSSTIDGYFFYVYFSNNFFNRIMSMTAKSSVDSVRKDMISEMLVPIPPKDEQLKISKLLTDTDELISSLEKLIEKKMLIKQGAMQQLLTGKKRLPGFSGKWKAKKLGEIGKCIRGVSYNGELDLFPYDTSRSVRLLRSNNIQNSTLSLADIQFVNQSRVKKNQIMLQDDILICMANGSKELVGKSALFNLSDKQDYTFGAFMGCFRISDDSSNRKFIYYNFNTHNYRLYIDILLSGSSINNLKPSDIESIEIYHPPFEEQTAIAQTLNDLDLEIENLEQKLNKYKFIKQGMMQNLLTGKIRLV